MLYIISLGFLFGGYMEIGKRIRQLRIKGNLTLEELASRTELTKGYLSQLERNLASPSIQTLEDITEALGTTMSRFFAEEDEGQIVFTAEDTFVDEQDEYTINWIVPNAQKNAMEPILLEIDPQGRSQVIPPHEGEELGYVINGRISLCRSDDPKGITVKKGETFYIKGNEEHYLYNRSTKKAVILWISTPPIF